MALRWVVQSACHVLGYQNDSKIQCNDVVGCPNKRSKISPSSQNGGLSQAEAANDYPCGFQMPLHYPRYKKEDYGKMEEWKIDMLLREYGLSFKGALDEKRAYAMGAFLWTHN